MPPRPKTPTAAELARRAVNDFNSRRDSAGLPKVDARAAYSQASEGVVNPVGFLPFLTRWLDGVGAVGSKLMASGSYTPDRLSQELDSPEALRQYATPTLDSEVSDA